MGRSLRAVRDDEEAAIAIGKSVVGLRLLVQGMGGALAGLSGALLVGFIGGWSPSAWAYVETLALLTAMIVGGRGSNSGASSARCSCSACSCRESSTCRVGGARLVFDLGWIIVGGLTIAFLFLRPQGIFPERRPRGCGRRRGPRRGPRAAAGPRRQRRPAGPAGSGPADPPR